MAKLLISGGSVAKTSVTSPFSWKAAYDTSGYTVVRASGATISDNYSINLSAATRDSVIVSLGAGRDTVTGSSYNDKIHTGAGDDAITGGAGNDELIGAAGNDTYTFSGDFGADSIGASTSGDKDVYKFSGINFSDLTFAQSGKKLVVTTAAGASATISSYTSSATIEAATTFIAADKTFHVFASTGAAISGTTGADYIFVDATTTINGKGGADTLVGGAGNDIFVYNKDVVKYVGGTSTNDTVTASGATASVTIDLFNSAMYSGIETAKTGTGNDLIRGSINGSETLYGGAGKDNVWSNSGNDFMDGQAGVDTYWFQAGDGNDTVMAGTVQADMDVYNFKNLAQSDLSFGYTSATKVLTASYIGDKVTVSGFTSGAADGLQKYQLFQTSDNTFHVFMETTGTNKVTGTTGNDYINLSGSTADITFASSTGADTIIGGSGNDVITYNSALASVNGGSGTNTLDASASTVAVDLNLASTKFTNVTYAQGGAYADVLRGSAETSDSLNGGIGNDHLWGRAGNDTLTGGAGADTFWFGNGDGNDVVTDGTSVDVVKMYDAPVTSQALSGGDLVLNIADGSSLTISGWENATSKLNKFEYNGTIYKLSNDATTWSKA